RASAQSVVSKWIYVLTSSQQSFDLLRVNTADGKTEQVFSLSLPSQETFTSFLPQSELDVAKSYFAGLKGGTSDLTAMASVKLDTFIDSISVAPDNQEVALNVRYQKCYFRAPQACFGVSQVILAISKRVVFSMGFHETQFAPKRCQP